MARICGKCHRALRYDEHLASFFVSGWGNGLVCEVCAAAAQGLPPPEPRRYPAGSPVPRLPGSDADMPVCGLCRHALVEGERTRPLRLRPEMPEVIAVGVECGCYAACADCCRRWQPVVFAYLKTHCADRLPSAFTVQQCGGSWLA